MSKLERKNSHRSSATKPSFSLGTIAFKETPEPSNRRYLWLDQLTKEIRWCIGSTPQHPCKRLSLLNIHSVVKISSPPYSGFKIQSNSHTFKFWLPNDREIKIWVSEIALFISADENIKTRKPQESLICAIEDSGTQALKSEIMSIFDAYIPEVRGRSIDEASEVLQTYLEDLVMIPKGPVVNEEIRMMREQTKCLEGKVKEMEDLREKLDKYSIMEKELEMVREYGAELGLKLEKLKSESAGFIKDVKELKNEASLLGICNEETEKPIINKGKLSGVVMLNDSPRLIVLIPNSQALHLYSTEDFSPGCEKILFSMIINMQINEEVLYFSLKNNFNFTIKAEKWILISIIETFNNFKTLTSNSTEKALNFYSLICEESDKQLRAFDKQIKFYKKKMTEQVCSMKELTPYEVFYISELETLLMINPETQNLSPASISYLNNERPKLISELLKLASQP